MYNIAGYAAKTFADDSDFVSEFLVDIYYYFQKSTKLQATLKNFCDFCDQDYRKILKYGATK